MSDLDRFLDGLQGEGQILEERSAFTLSSQEALRKLANFQLPFRGAWATKVIQCAVADNTGSSIEVRFSGREVHFVFAIESFTADDFQSAFYSAEPSRNRALQHLVEGLWGVAFQEGRAFQLVLSDAEKGLIWNGLTLQQVEAEPGDVRLTVGRVVETSQKLAWLKETLQVMSKKAEIVGHLADLCFPCPVALTVDGKRFDGLQECPTHGWGEKSYPFAIRAAGGDMPPLPLPPGSFDEAPKRTGLTEKSSLDKVCSQLLGASELKRAAPLPYVLSFSAELVTRNKTADWKNVDKDSLIYWVKDGVVVGQDTLHATGHVSLACFANAVDLPTDLTGLQLRQSEEKQVRLARAKQALRDALAEATDLEDRLKAAFAEGRGLAVFSASLGVLLLSGILGLYYVQEIIYIFGGGVFALGCFAARKESNKSGWLENILSGIEELRKSFLENETFRQPPTASAEAPKAQASPPDPSD